MIKMLIRVFLLLCIIPICRFNIIQPHFFQNFEKLVSENNYSKATANTDNTFQKYFESSHSSDDGGLAFGMAVVADNKEVSFQKILKGLFSFTAFIVLISTIFICLPIRQNILLLNRVLSIQDKPYIDLRVIKI